jgi:AcrR family transcriptional regulator
VYSFPFSGDERSLVKLKSVADMSPTMRATRNRILDGASNVMRAKGIEATTVEDILRSSEVSRRTFYQYFSSKADLLGVIYDDSAMRLVSRMKESTGGEEMSGKVANTVDAYLQYQREGGSLVIALQAEATRPESQLRIRREKTLDAVVAMIHKSVYSALSLSIDPLAYRALLIAIDGMVIDLQRVGSFTQRDSERVRIIAIVLFSQLLSAGRELPIPDYLVQGAKN